MRFWHILLGLAVAVFIVVEVLVIIKITLGDSEKNFQKYQEKLESAKKALQHEGD